MKKIALMLILLLLAGAACAETGNHDYSFSFDEDGYSGEWVTVALDGLTVELCLPDGWTGDVGEDGVYSASDGAEDVQMTLRVAAEQVDDLEEWAGENLDGWDMDEAGLYDVAVTQGESALEIYVPASRGRLLVYRFEGDGADALFRAYALMIAGSGYEGWMD